MMLVSDHGHIGHALLDNMLPWFHSASLLHFVGTDDHDRLDLSGLQSLDQFDAMDIAMLVDDRDSELHMFSTLAQYLSRRVEVSARNGMYVCMLRDSDGCAQTLSRFHATSPDGLVCFGRLSIGVFQLPFYHVAPAGVYEAPLSITLTSLFREVLVRGLHWQHPTLMSMIRPSSGLLVTLVNRRQGRRLLNIDELKQNLSASLQGTASVRVVYLEDLSLPEQVTSCLTHRMHHCLQILDAGVDRVLFRRLRACVGRSVRSLGVHATKNGGCHSVRRGTVQKNL